MNNYFKFEFKRALFSKNTFLAIIIVLISLIIPCYFGSIIPFPNDDGINFFIRIGAFLPMSYLPLLAPLISCIPYSNSYISDKSSGILKYIYTKIEFREYFNTKLIVNALVSGLVFLVPQIIMLIILIIFKGINNENMEIVGAFSSIYYNNKMIYALILIFMQFIFGSVFSTFALGVSAVTENKYLTIIVPFIYVIITGTVFEIIGINKLFNFNVVTLFDISYSASMTGINIIVHNIAIFLIGMILFYYFGDKKRYE